MYKIENTVVNKWTTIGRETLQIA